jgi:hypothetical protein
MKNRGKERKGKALEKYRGQSSKKEDKNKNDKNYKSG